jgi:hypothetical protein
MGDELPPEHFQERIGKSGVSVRKCDKKAVQRPMKSTVFAASRRLQGHFMGYDRRRLGTGFGRPAGGSAEPGAAAPEDHHRSLNRTSSPRD